MYAHTEEASRPTKLRADLSQQEDIWQTLLQELSQPRRPNNSEV